MRIAIKYLPLLLRNLARNLRGTLLTGVSIAVSIFVFASLMSLPGAVDAIVQKESGSLRLLTFASSGFLNRIPSAYMSKISRVPGVIGVAGELLFMGTLRDRYNPVRSAAIDAAQAERVWPDWITSETAAEFRRYRDGALAGHSLMRHYGWKVGDNIIVRGTIYPVDLQLRIVGELKSNTPSGALFFRLDYLDEALGRPGQVNLFWIKVDSAAEIPSVIAAINEQLSGGGQIETETENNLIAGQLKSYGLMINGAKVLAFIVIITIALVALNTASMSVRERRTEIAIMRAVGFQRAMLVALISVEGTAIGFIAAVFGCAAAATALRAVTHVSESIGPLADVLRLTSATITESLMVGLVLGLAASALPALIATRHPVVDGLRAIR